MEIKQLTNFNDNLFCQAIDLIYEEWGKFFSKTKSERANQLILAQKNNQDFPKMFALVSNDVVLGTFWFKQMEVNKQLVPSLWYLVVNKQQRGNGYGKIMLEFIDDYSKKHFPCLYLVTHHQNLYEKFGYAFVKEIPHNGETDRLYVKYYKNQDIK